jgi:hypothetical protein
VSKATGLYGLNLKVTTAAAQTSATATTTFVSQGFKVDSPTTNGLYYAYIDSSNNLYYAAINDVTFAKTYEFYFNLVISSVSYSSSAPWLSVTLDNQIASNGGYAYVYIANNQQKNALLMFSKSTGAINLFT